MNLAGNIKYYWTSSETVLAELWVMPERQEAEVPKSKYRMDRWGRKDEDLKPLLERKIRY